MSNKQRTGTGTLIVLRRVCLVEMVAGQYKVTTGYGDILQISHQRKLF